MLEPTNAEAYLLSGRINQRRGDQEAAQQVLADRFSGRAQGRDAREQGEAHCEQRHQGHHRRKGEAACRLREAFFPAAPSWFMPLTGADSKPVQRTPKSSGSTAPTIA